MERTTKRFFALLLSVLMMLTCSTVAFAAEDVPESIAIEDILPGEEPGGEAEPLPEELLPPEEGGEESLEAEEPPTAPEEPAGAAAEPAGDEPGTVAPAFVNEGYYSARTGALTSAQMADKREMAGTAEAIANLSPGLDYISGQAIFMADTKDEAEVIAATYGAQLIRYDERVGVIQFPHQVTEVVGAAENLALNIPAVYPNMLYTVDTGAQDAAVETAVETTDNYHDFINTTDAWNTSNGSGVLVAVVDSGVNTTHEDLKGNISGAVNKNALGYNGGKDNNGHGSHVSGIIAAKANNGKGYHGVAPDAKILSVKALEHDAYLDNATGSTADIVMAINHAASNKKVRIINMSLGASGFSATPTPFEDKVYRQALQDASDKGIIIVAAAGNDGLVFGKYYPGYGYYVDYPNCFVGIDNMISVAASGDETNANANYNMIAEYSNRDGSSNIASYTDIVDIIAPGTGIASTWFGGNNLYARISGTSMAAPVVSGVLALILSANPDLKAERSVANAQTAIEILLGNANGTVAGEPMVSASKPAAAIPAAVSKPAILPSLVYNKLIFGGPRQTTVELVHGIDTPAGAEIFYTLNGKNPVAYETATCFKYEGPFTIEGSGNKTVKAIAAYLGRKSPVTTQKVNVFAHIMGVEITQAKGSTGVLAGSSLTFKATYTPTFATSKKVLWSVEPADAGTISAKGVFKANKALAAITDVTITATSNDADGYAVKDTYALKVYPKGTDTVFQMGDIASPAQYVASGKTLQLKLDVNSGTGGKLVTWASDNPGIAKVNTSGKVTAAKKVATATDVTITATPLKPGDPLVAAKTTTVTVYPATTKLATTQNKKVTLYLPGNTIPQTTFAPAVTVQPANAANANQAARPLTYTSSKPAVAKVEVDPATGQATVIPLATGKTTIKAVSTDGTKKSISYTVTVARRTEQMYIINKASPSGMGIVGSYEAQQVFCHVVGLKKSINMSAILLPTSATSRKVEWFSSNTRIATVNASGKITGKSLGTVKITAKAKDNPDLLAEFYVEVKPPVSKVTPLFYYKIGSGAPGWYYNARNFSLDTGELIQLSAFVEDANYDCDGDGIKDFKDSDSPPEPCFTWVDAKSSNPTIGNVYYDSTYGWLLKASRPGKVTITMKAVDGSGKSGKLSFRIYG